MKYVFVLLSHHFQLTQYVSLTYPLYFHHISIDFLHSHHIAISGGGTLPFSGGQNFAGGPPAGGACGTVAEILWAMGWALGTGRTLMWVLFFIYTKLILM